VYVCVCVCKCEYVCGSSANPSPPLPSPPPLQQFNGPNGTPLLSDVRLQLLREYKSKLQSVRKHRVQEMQELAKVCVQHMTDLVLQEEEQPEGSMTR